MAILHQNYNRLKKTWLTESTDKRARIAPRFMHSKRGVMAPNSTVSIDQTLEGVVKSLRSGTTTIMCGAGISRWSGLPMAVELVKHVLTEVGASQEDIATLTGSGKLPLPFELFIEILLEDGIDFISEVYAAGEPNLNHILFAKMMKMGYLRTIVTTNFDRLIERALEAEGLAAGSGYDLLSRESDFARIDWSEPKCRLIKIHGTVDDPTTLAATIRAITAQRPSESRRSVVEHVFSIGADANVLVLGYSCSDVFDIAPQIESLGPSLKCIVLNEYSKDSYIEPISQRNDNNAFKQFQNGWRLGYDTDILVDRLWKELVGPNPPKREQARTNWEDIVSIMLRRGPRTYLLRHYFPAQLLFQMGKHESSRSHLEQAMKEAERVADYTGALYIQMTMAQVCFRLGDYKTSRGWCEFILKEMDDTTRESNLAFTAYICMGATADAQGDMKVAVECFSKALQNARHRNHPFDLFLATQKYAVALIRMGKIEEGMQLFASTLESARQNGDKQLEGVCLGGIGCVYKDNGLHQQAITYLEMALMIAQKLGDRKNEGDWLGNLGSVYQNIGDHQQALDLYKEAKEIAVMLGDKESESTWLSNMGISYKETGNYLKALDCYESAIKIDRLLGNKRGLGIGLNNLGNLYHLNGKREQARKCILESIELAVEIGDVNDAAKRKRLLEIVERG